ncbi:MAG: GGDEF domain-containing protein [Pegethrix bostrychoides GSE-TBD4-15B]|jgi:two-component system cell cycle response regulator|uniref:GGDEF domain-containing protein n=1 Tax=Pegethrix bostrychoides GSE-TBD4-15B TaxID=2839662 RepID=A0A951PEX5_9CYAN|nr:GGDEF domain-containing protein [Pegethrix bostrychoides GSE-TBD4-15B]
MDAAILLIGDEEFCNPLLDLIQTIKTLAIQTLADPLEAMPLILAQQPELVLVQAVQEQSLALCGQIKAESRLAWIYCTVVEDQDRSSPATELERRASALEAGADAYLYLPQGIAAAVRDSQRLLQAQIRVGLRQVQTYRELMHTNDVLSAIALSDPLTSLNNRRAFEWELPRQIQNARSRSIPLSVIMLDVDFFKAINDTYGHLTGDQMLKFLAARLRHNLRIYDTPFRYGGEEFVIILSNTDAPEAMRIAARLCQLVSEQPFAVDEQLDLTITISAGTATLQPSDDAQGFELLHRADQYLLQAKAQGRNQVVGYKAE